MLAFDGEHGAEVYSGATNERQAWEVFRPTRIMALRSPQQCSAIGPGDGSSPHCAIHDEYHEHDTDDRVSSMETSMGAREQLLRS